MQITSPVNGIIERIPVGVRVWLGVQVIKLGEWLVASEYTADVNLVAKASAK